MCANLKISSLEFLLQFLFDLVFKPSKASNFQGRLGSDTWIVRVMFMKAE